MIPRYSRLEMTKIWEAENKYKIWFEIEAHACDALATLGVIPTADANNIWKNAPKVWTKEDVAKIDEIEQVTKHDVIAFLTHLASYIGESTCFVYQGITT